MKKVHWTTLILLSGIALAIISMFLVFPSLDQKAIEEYKTHYKYINSEEERDFSGNTFIKEPADDSIPMEYSQIEEYMEPALQRITLLVGTLLFAWSLLMPYKWAVKSGFYRFFTQRLPYEITLGAALLGLYFYKIRGSELVYRMFRLPEDFSLDILSADTWQISSYYLLQIACLSGLFAVLSGCGYAIRSMQHNGVRVSLQKHSLLTQNSVLLGRQAKRLYRYIIGFDFHDKGELRLLAALFLHIVCILIVCIYRDSGIFFYLLLSCYCLILYSIRHRQNSRMKRDFQSLEGSIQRVANGDFQTTVDEDLGIYESLKDNLQNIETSFQEAVAQEVRSQNMRTELITNVSHDLKTPLTSMISYIDLLKNKNLPEEERLRYITILESGSNRLKHLIEDLFEVSKASSGSVSLHLEPVDLVSLIKEVRLELSERIAGCGVDFRWKLPEEKVMVNLDGQRTYRIFENLLVNIMKYAMPGTRAYVNLEQQEGFVVVTLMNISASEISVSPQELMERFVRGDESRNTEGSGLGLAIAKSFTELQEGTMELSLEGDLFRVVLRWKMLGEEA